MSPLLWFRKPAGAAELSATTVGTIWLRMTVNGTRTDLSTGIRTAYGQWNTAAQRLRGQSDHIRQANARLGSLIDTAQGHYYALERAGLPVTAERLKRLMQGADLQADETLLASWQEFHLHQQRRFEAGEITLYTASLPSLRLPHLTRWLKSYLKRPGILTRELTPALVRDFRLWLLSAAVPSVTSAGYANKVARLLSECASCAVERGTIAFHPCPKLKLPAPKPTVLKYLTAQQVEALQEMAGLSGPMSRTRDGFLLQCHTGLAWADAHALRAEHVSAPDRAGQRWLRLPRQKTSVTALIPLLPAAAALLDKYYPKPVPVCANQLYNARLKILGERLGLAFQLTSHIGRKTFAMLAAESGVSLDSIGAMLGHVNLKHTHLYAQITEQRVGREMREAGLL